MIIDKKLTAQLKNYKKSLCYPLAEVTWQINIQMHCKQCLCLFEEDLLHLLVDRKRISANPNPIVTLTSLTLKRNNVFGLTK